MAIIHTQAFARAGLIGNPSDGYFGKTISVTVRNFSAQVRLWESPRLTILPQRADRWDYADIGDLMHDVYLHGYYGGVRLIKAAIKKFHDYCRQQNISTPRKNFTIEYETNVPVRVGLAGSSAIVTATMRALLEFYGVQVPKPLLPGLILSVELDELKIGAGLQDRVIQVYQGCVFMDFAKSLMDQQGHGNYQEIAPALLPPLYIAYHDNLAEGTEVTHNDLRARYNRCEKEVLDGIETWAGYAQQARDLILAGKGGEIGALMDANFDLRRKLIKISSGNIKLVETGRKFGASAKFAGSGGAIIGTYDGDPQRLARMTDAYAEFGAKVIVPQITA